MVNRVLGASLCIALAGCGFHLAPWPQPISKPVPPSGASMTLECQSGTLDLGGSITFTPAGKAPTTSQMGANLSNSAVCSAIGSTADLAGVQHTALSLTSVRVYGAGLSVTVSGADVSCSSANCTN